ncbi:hypothetical protein [Candidatus Hodgkinia cicadicola]|uniref:hypothetical protein n=1 Tax=Candidatus Hodgkinia cicadicola TaxID=573658 RepID=UPI001788D745
MLSTRYVDNNVEEIIIDLNTFVMVMEVLDHDGTVLELIKQSIKSVTMIYSKVVIVSDTSNPSFLFRDNNKIRRGITTLCLR